MKKGDKFKCTKTVKNFFGWPLFVEGDTYEVLHIEEIMGTTLVTLNHILYANEYEEQELSFIEENFTPVTE
jgi:hypothetical protein